jgi:predicted AAA+ superfamily ATPase
MSFYDKKLLTYLAVTTGFFNWHEGVYEIDFVVPYKAQLLGIEVKTKKNKSSKSVTEFKNIFHMRKSSTSIKKTFLLFPKTL